MGEKVLQQHHTWIKYLKTNAEIWEESKECCFVLFPWIPAQNRKNQDGKTIYPWITSKPNLGDKVSSQTPKYIWMGTNHWQPPDSVKASVQKRKTVGHLTGPKSEESPKETAGIYKQAWWVNLRKAAEMGIIFTHFNLQVNGKGQWGGQKGWEKSGS